jgi:hypothetical protein
LWSGGTRVPPSFRRKRALTKVRGGEKAKDFEDLKKVTGLISNKAHFTPEGMDQIIKIKSQMNKGRKELI